MKGLGTVVGVVVVAGAAAAVGVLLTRSGNSTSLDGSGLGSAAPSQPATGEIALPGAGTGVRPTTPLRVVLDPGRKAPVPANGGPRLPGGARTAKKGTARRSRDARVGGMIDGLEGAVRDPNGGRDGAAIISWLEKLLEAGKDAIPDIIDALERAKATDRAFRKQLVVLLQRLDHPLATDALRDLAMDTSDSDMHMRKLAAISLGLMDAKHAVPALREILASKGQINSDVRVQAVDSLTAHGGDAAFETVRGLALDESDPAVQAQAVNALDAFRDRPEVIDILVEVARNNPDRKTRGWARNALARNPDSRAGEELARQLEGTSEQYERNDLYLALQRRTGDKAAAAAIRRGLNRETNDALIRRAISSLIAVDGAGARGDVEAAMRRYQHRKSLYIFLRSMTKIIESREKAAQGPHTPAPPHQPAKPK